MSCRCVYCNHKLDVPADLETRSTPVRRVPLCRGGGSRKEIFVTACALCAKAKGPMTDGEYRRTMGDTVARKNWQRLIHLNIKIDDPSERAEAVA